jgi:hypothetical protein
MQTNKAALVEAIYTASNTELAFGAWNQVTQAIELTNNEQLLIRGFVTNRLLNDLFSETIPLEPFELSFFNSSFCNNFGATPPTGIPPGTSFTSTSSGLLRENTPDELVIVREGRWSDFRASTYWYQREAWGIENSWTNESSDQANTFQAIMEHDSAPNSRLIWNMDIAGWEIVLYNYGPGIDVFLINDVGGPGETLIPMSEGTHVAPTTNAFAFWSEGDFSVTVTKP